MRYLLVYLLLACSLPLAAQHVSTDDSSQNAGKVEWSPRMIEVDSVVAFGVPVTREFIVKNWSKEDLVFTKVRTGCSCTMVDYTQTPIPPNKGGIVRVTYDAQKEGDFYRVITVTTNFDPAQPVALILKGKVAKM